MIFVDYTNLPCPSSATTDLSSVPFGSDLSAGLYLYILLEDKVKFLNLMASMNVRFKPNVPV